MSPHRRRNILFCALGTVLTLIVALALWQRETLYFIFNPDRIQIKPAHEIEAALRDGGYEDLTEAEDGLFCRLLDGSIELSVAFEKDELSRLNADFNMYKVPIKTVSDALDKAIFVLSPYLSPPEIKALCFLIAGEMPAYISSEAINYSREIDGCALTVRGNMSLGDAVVEVRRLAP